MRPLLLAGLLSIFVLNAQPTPGTGSIEGHVFNSHTGTPVRKATVILRADRFQLVANTDSDGLFQFSALPVGPYKLSASQSGFLDHPARRPILLGADEHATGAEIRLPPQGVIAGHVLDEDGDAVGRGQVILFKQRYHDGRKQWDRFDGTSANDLGEYRFPNLRPGRYLTQAVYSRPMVDSRYGDRDRPDKPTMMYVPAFYPNAPNEEAAAPIEVGPGADVRGIDIHLFQVARPPSFHVQGKIAGVPPNSGIDIALSLSPANREGAWGNAVASPPDYTFDARVPSGQYSILAHVYSGGPEAFASGSVTVTQNVSGLVLLMSPPPEVTGRITLAESGGKTGLKGLNVSLTRLMANTVPGVRSDATGKLVFAKPVWPGHYSLDIKTDSIPDGCFVQAIKLGGREVSPDDFEIINSAQLEIVLSNTAGRVSGSVSDDNGKPVPNSVVALIPRDATSRPVKLLANDDGKFTFTALRPGKYTLFAWEEVDDDLWPDPDFRKQYENRATEITIAPSETQTAQLHTIPAEEIK